MDPAEHFLWLGARLGRKPSRDSINSTTLFLSDNLNKNDDLLVSSPAPKAADEAKTKLRQEIDEKKSKIYQTFDTSDYFDKQWYIRTYSHSMNSNEDPISHYIKIGVERGYDPSEKFSTKKYLDVYRDVRAAGVNPLFHYITSGKREGRSPKPEFPKNTLNLTRITRPEYGTLGTVLKFDAPPTPVAEIEGKKIAVHIHLYYIDMADEFVRYISNIRHCFSLLVSIPQDQSELFWKSYFESRLSRAVNVTVKSVPNRGRDVAPWLVYFRHEIKNSDIFLHIHSKQSHYNKSHSGWFRYLIHTMLGSESVVDQILNIISQKEDVGVIAPFYYWTLANQPNFGKNKDACEKLFKRLSDRPFPGVCPDYPAGSFFWCRTSVLRPLFDLEISIEEFPEEKGQIDETVAHAVERIMGILPSLCGMTCHMVTVDIAYNLTRYINPPRTRLSHSIKRPHVCTGSRGSGKAAEAKIAVFSCISGEYETPIPLITHREGVDCYLFSDKKLKKAPEGYETIISNYINPEPVRTARFVKTHPHIWFKDYDYAVWIDSNVHFYADIFEYCERLIHAEADCGFIPHPVRHNFAEEYAELLRLGIISGDLAESQIDRYCEDDKLLKSRLVETNFFICRPQSPAVSKFMQIWWAEINRFTHRDQLSVNYALETSGVKWTEILEEGRSARDHSDFLLFSHDYINRESVIEFVKS